MKRFLIALCLLFPLVATAAIETNGLTDKQKAELALQAAQMKEQATAIPANPEDIKKWVGMGEEIGNVLIGLSGKLGIAMDQLLDSKVGLIAVLLIVWHVIGSALIHIGLGIMWLIIMTTLWWRLFHKMCVVDNIDEEYYENGKIKQRVINTYKSRDVSDERHGAFIVSGILIVVIGLITIFTF